MSLLPPIPSYIGTIIPINMRKSDQISKKITIAKEDLANLRSSYAVALNAQSWRTQDGNSSREVRNANLATLARLIREKEKEISDLESLLDDVSRYTVKVGAIL